MGSIQRGSRFAGVMAAMAVAMMATPHMGRAEALEAVGGYRSRGKGQGNQHFGPGNGASRSQRSARKARNQARHRAACR